MVKILLEKYPMGSFKGQKTPGKYMDGYYYENLKILAEKIVDDMTFMGVVFSSTLEVGTGKSVFITQTGEAWSELIKKLHGIDVPFNLTNVVWKPEDLIERSFVVPKYSCIILDEWEDAHYWSKLGTTLRQFFRKCRQLNLLILVVIPNWFQMPMNYAVSRSTFAVDVRFENNFERGFFRFYNFKAKRELYIKGKKWHNYNCVKPTFYGRFPNGYGVDEKKYREEKLKDMMEYNTDDLKEMNPKKKMFLEIKDNFNFNNTQWAKYLGVCRKTIYNWRVEGKTLGNVVGKRSG
jgi:hypothetical protein